MNQATMADNMCHISDDLLRDHFPVHYACMIGDETRVKELLANAGRNFDVYQEDGVRSWTPMHWAALGGHWKCLAELSDFYGIGMDVQNKRFNQNPAHVAAMAGHAECIAWLVHKGFAPGMQLGCLREVGHRPGSLDVRNSRTGETPTHFAAQGGHVQCLHWLLQRGNGYAQQDYMGDTPLHKAAKLGDVDCVKLLTSHDPALSVYNHNGDTPLDVAAKNGHNMCKAFLEQASLSQHSSFLPSASSPILMNGEGIYQRQKISALGGMVADIGNEQDMEMGEEMSCGGNAPEPVSVGFPSVKRSFDEVEEETNYKRRRLFAPTDADKLGTPYNNNVLSSYNSVLAMSAESGQTLDSPYAMNETQQVHALPGQLPKHCVSNPNLRQLPEITSSSSVLDHCNAVRAQHGYDSMLTHCLIESDHGS